MGQSKHTVLVIEDDRALRDGLAMNLELEGHRVITAGDGEAGMRRAFDDRPDLIVLDIMLPGYSGLEILDELRKRREGVPVLVLSARGTTTNKVEGLELGADDYLSKPFELPELLARVRAMLRRRELDAGSEEAFAFSDITIHPASRTVERQGVGVELSAKEFDLLVLLARAPGQVFSREAILERVWGWGYEGTARTVDNFVANLRRKLEADPAHPRHIVTVRQVGYKWVG